MLGLEESQLNPAIPLLNASPRHSKPECRFSCLAARLKADISEAATLDKPPFGCSGSNVLGILIWLQRVWV